MSDARYFELLDHIGVEPAKLIDPQTGDPVDNPMAGELQPAQAWGFFYAQPTVDDDGQVVAAAQRAELTPIPGTRIFKVDDPLIANVAAQATEVVREIDAPSKKQLDTARKTTEAARERPASGDPDQPQEA